MYNSSLNLNLYKIFYDVAYYGSVSLASKNLMISQPAISRSIKKLEEDLNVTLFYRTLNGMILTEKGKELLSYVEEACNSLKIGEREMMETSNLVKGKLAIGCPSHIAGFFLFKKVADFHKDYPNIEVSVISRSTKELIELLDKHELDFIIDTSPITESEKELTIEEISKSTHVFACRSDLDYKANSIKDLVDYPLILPVPHSSHRKRLNEVAIENNIKFNNVLSIETSEMIASSILQGAGVGYILEDVIKRDVESGVIKILNIEETLPSVTINLVYINKYLMAAPRKFIDEYLKDNINK